MRVPLSAPRPTPEGVKIASARGRWIWAAAVLGSGLAGIDSAVVNVALPIIGRDMNVGFSRLQWAITGYTLSLAALILLAGALGDHFGRRRVLLIGVVGFAGSSVLCAVAPGIDALIGARSLQ